MNFIERPREIKAFQWMGEVPADAPDWFTELLASRKRPCILVRGDGDLDMLSDGGTDGWHRIHPTDWVVMEGELEDVPVRWPADEFAKEYQSAKTTAGDAK
jgi:hypothetical protein